MTDPVDRPPGVIPSVDPAADPAVGPATADGLADPATTDRLADPAAADRPDVGAPGPPGLRTFSLEGRRAPGLYLFGWLAVVLGGPIMVVAILSASRGITGLLLIGLGALLFGTGLIAAAGAQGIERRDRLDLAYRGPSPFLVFGASIPLTILAQLPFVLLGFDLPSLAATLLGVGLSTAVYVVLLGLTVVGVGALRWSEIAIGIVGCRARSIGADLLIGATATVPVIPLTAIVSAILVRVTGVTPQGSVARPTSTTELVILFIAAAIVAPISEELFFRGFATTAWLRSYGARRAIVEGGLFFAFVHILTLSGADFDHAGRAALVAFGARIPVAIALGWIFVWRRSLAASIGLHATFNGFLVVLSALAMGSVPG